MSAGPNGVHDPGGEAAPGFNENHRSQLRLTFQHIDKLLSESNRTLSGDENGSPFSKYTPDAIPLQRKVVGNYVARVRAAMVRIMQAQDIPFAPPICGSLWAARTSLTFVSVALEELTPRRLRGYGPLSEEAGAEVDRIRLELHELVGRLASYLAQGESGDLQARLARLEDTSDEVALLRELERIITAHGLVEVRGSLALLLDRLEGGNTFEIGVFGRVSAGKSSLLNYLMGGEFLPVGVTPVTALPTRIRYGAQAGATVVFAERRDALKIDLARLPEFTTEQQNPANAKHVARIEVRVPASRLLREGVTFVDTPGLGSLALAGAAETIAYLPRCDLGIVLVDAGASLTHEDLTIVQALYQAGAYVQVLVSKADLLAPADQVRTVDYLREHLLREAGVVPNVYLVSVAGAQTGMCEAWLDGRLKPLLDGHKQQALAARRRKIGALREAVIRALRARTENPVATGPVAPDQETDTVLREGAMRFESAQEEGYKLASVIAGSGAEIVVAAARDIADHGAGSTEHVAEAAALLGRATMGTVNSVTTQARRQLDQIRTQALEALELTSANVDSADPLPAPYPLPVMTLPTAFQRLELPGSRWLAVFRKTARQHRIASHLQAEIGLDLHDLLRRHGEQVRAWFVHSLAAMKAAFAVQADLRRAASAAIASTDGREQPDVATISRDLSILQNWKANAPL